MDFWMPFLAVVAAILLGAMSPGPSFVLVVRTAAASTRKAALATAFGMGAGGLVFATAAILGLHIVLSTAPALYLFVKLAGAAYLLYLATSLWWNAGKPIAIDSGDAARRDKWQKSFVRGLATQLSNPKTAIVYASIFTAFLSVERPAWLSAILVACVFVVEFGWYALVALAFSSEIPRRRYLQGKRWLDRTAGSVMGLLAARLLAEAAASFEHAAE